MLRITRSETSELDATTLRVEGWLVADSLEALANECRGSLGRTSRVRLDLSGVTFIDGRGVSLLRDLRGSCLEILNCPPFVEGLLAGPPDR
ncbi:MAG: STAS domain-containing protein [Candidatus Rokuibacteriota bacterium]